MILILFPECIDINKWQFALWVFHTFLVKHRREQLETWLKRLTMRFLKILIMNWQAVSPYVLRPQKGDLEEVWF